MLLGIMHNPDRKPQGSTVAADPHEILIRKLKEHSRLGKADLTEIKALKFIPRELGPNEDIVRQGDRPNVSVLVVSGVVARYHLLPSGRRQYLAFHFAGDMPDSQAIFVDRMDHAVCAIGPAKIVSILHRDLLAAFERHPSLAFAIWRETLIDAAIFREAVTNNSARSTEARTAHLFCELYYRSRASGLTDDETCDAPITLGQWGEALGMSLATVNRVLSEMRATGFADFRNGRIIIRDWERLINFAEFSPSYLHLKAAPL
jgi:CRP-like cAMP-binding protein